MRWENVDRELLEKLYYEEGLSDQRIADRCQVSKNKVIYKRKKYGITQAKRLYRQYEKQNAELFQTLNQHSCERLWKRENVDELAKAITNYVLCGEPVQEMRADGRLTLADLELLGQHMSDRLSGLLSTAVNGDWCQLELLYGRYRLYGADQTTKNPDQPDLTPPSKPCLHHS